MRLNACDLHVIWELARDCVGTEKAYDEAPFGPEKTRLSAEIHRIFLQVKNMGDEAGCAWLTFCEILRRREED